MLAFFICPIYSIYGRMEFIYDAIKLIRIVTWGCIQIYYLT